MCCARCAPASPSPNTRRRKARRAPRLRERLPQDSLAEWSKALASGASPQGRGFEPHSCHFPSALMSHSHTSPFLRGCVLRTSHPNCIFFAMVRTSLAIDFSMWHQGTPCIKYAHAGSRTRVTSMGGLYDAVTLHALCTILKNIALLNY